jgi:hypothetical protein
MKITDHQEHAAHMKAVNNKRTTIEKTLKNLKAQLPRSHALVYNQIIDQIAKLEKQLDQIDKDEKHLFGYFHGLMGGIRGICNVDGDLCLEGLTCAAGYGAVWGKISSCANGFSDLALSLFKAMNVSWLMVTIKLMEELGINVNDMTVDSFHDKCKEMSSCSPHFRVYDSCLRGRTNIILNLYEASRIPGPKGSDLLTSAAKHIVRLFSVSGNHNFLNAVPFDLANRYTGEQKVVDALYWNPTITLRETKTVMFGDQIMENFGVRYIKSFLPNIRSYNFETKAELMKHNEGKVCTLEENLFGKDKDIPKTTHDPAVVNNIMVQQMVTALYSNLRDIIKDEYQATPTITNPKRFHCIVPFNKPQSSLEQNPNYFYKLEEIMTERSDVIFQRTARKSVSGEYQTPSTKKVISPVVTPFIKTKKVTHKQLVNNTEKLNGVLALMGKYSHDFFLYPWCIAKPSQGDPQGLFLRTGIKSLALNGILKVFGESPCLWSNNHIHIDDHGAQRTNYVRSTSSDAGEVVNIDCTVHDANYSIRTLPPFSSTTTATAFDVMKTIFNHLAGKDFEKGVKTTIIVFDQSFCVQKAMEEGKRNESSKKNKKTPPSFNDFKEGNLGSHAKGKFMQVVAGDRHGSRMKMQGRIGDRVRALINPSDEVWSAEDKQWLVDLLSKQPGATIKIAGVGNTSEERQHWFTITLSADKQIRVKDEGKALQREDTEVIRLALLEIMQGRNVLVVGTDTDLWLIAALNLSKKFLANGSTWDGLGKLFVNRMKQSSTVEDRCLVDCNDLVQLIINNSNLQTLDASLRVPNVVVAIIAMGGDTTSGIVQVSHSTGIKLFVENAGRIGSLVSPSTDCAGHLLKVDYIPFQKYYKLLFVSRCPSLFVEKWKGMSCQEQHDFVETKSWNKMMETMATHYITNLCMFMMSEENLMFCILRVQSRINRWNNTEFQCPSLDFKNFGFEVYLKNGSIVSEPTDAEIQVNFETSIEDQQIKSVWPKCTRDRKGRPYNSSFEKLYGTPQGVPKNILRDALQHERGSDDTNNVNDEEAADTTHALQAEMVQGAGAFFGEDEVIHMTENIAGCAGRSDIDYVLNEGG